ncbi:MAG TPA: family 43 glycosylhydrolase [Paenibacillus sp.]|uniref:OmpL47-type beta-barrel domain-containing protein n=1 Tax=Paenibacillus sp. TaxID=58172 RepID=UPI002D0F89DB|nr:family 43 glycosylhydrolase [Paenibacillus sp.]HUC92840.1 family 43 glycosylhydrolase [Paenibacillus sp.]
MRVKMLPGLLICALLVGSIFVPGAFAAETVAGPSAAAAPFTEQQLKDNDYILYFVNAGDRTPESAEAGDKLGLYASVTEQTYGPDSVTGKAWGLATTTSNTSVSDETKSFGSLRYYNGPQVWDKALVYQFELPPGDYDVTLGFRNPWGGRAVNIFVEGTNVSGGDYDIGSGVEKMFTKRWNRVDDGQMTVRIQGPATAALNNYNDPLVSFITVRQSVIIPLSDLEAKIAEAKSEAAKPEYAPYSVAALNAVIGEAEALAARVNESGIGNAAVQEDIRAAIAELNKAISELFINEPNTSFKPGQVWRDTNGAVIQAHGGGILFDEQTKQYYWYGEDKTNGYLPARGVRVYSSTDLYNWEDRGLALTAIESMDQFDTDPLISALYAGRTDRADIFNDIGTQRILERPKVIYNEKTKKYVMWLHTDGPSATSDANYAKAEAGYALSDSPTGPFVYGVSNRMDRAPKDAAYNGQPNQPGMARDMTLFKDDDGTAYLIYSSEENRTIYISKLNEEYTDVVGWHRDGNVQRDTEYKAVYGEDYIRVFPGAQREAPAMFKYDGKYYMITSGATGWAPNPARYTVADDIFGEWKPLRDPSVGAKASTTFDSQSTYVIPVDPAKGKFIYMGDRWISNDLKQSKYIWLPIEFGQNDEIMLKWYDEWTLDKLDGMGKVTVNTSIPEKATVGQPPALPDVLNVSLIDGTALDTPVEWIVSAGAFDKPGLATIRARLAKVSNKELMFKINVIPEHAIYFVHAGGALTGDYLTWSGYMAATLQNKGVPDQQYNPEIGQTWGYVGNATRPAGGSEGDLFSSLRYLLAKSGDDLTYAFNLNNGRYKVYVGLYDWWYSSTRGSRKADIVANGTTLTKGYVFTDAYDVLGYDNIEVTDGKLELTVRRTAGSPDPQISWIMIVDEQAPATTAALQPEAPNGAGGWYTSDAALTLTASDEGAGVASTEYRVNGGEWRPYAAPVTLSQEGLLTVEYRSKDLAGNMEEVKSVAVKLDKTNPELQLEVDQPVIGPPNHKLVPVQVKVSAADGASGIAKVELTSITSNEPDNGSGDGNTEVDIQGAEFGTDDREFSLRAERSGGGEGRIYTITYTATDEAGRNTTASVQVKVAKGEQ